MGVWRQARPLGMQIPNSPTSALTIHERCNQESCNVQDQGIAAALELTRSYEDATT